jgi:signal transduction histidine kinase
MDAIADIHASNAARIEQLGGIIRQYNDLTEKLQHSHAQLQQTVQSLRSELSEKNRQLERRKRLAALGEMAAGMAHEIRNPLGGIELYASMLAIDVAQQPGPLQLVNKISAGVKRLESLVSHVLQFSREIQPQLTPCDLAEVVDQARELAGDRLHGGIECRLHGPRPMPVRVDPLLIGQAILNLLINAVEAVDQAGTIEMAWAQSPEGGFRFSIRDSGPGIPPAALDRIFNPFFTTKESGTGLGLAIVHRIVEAHDGTITASNAPKGGAIFEFRI